MKIVQLATENFQRLKVVNITPDGNIVTIGGKNAAGKSSVLNAIYVALKGLSAAPPQPIRAGEEKCHIRLDLGEMVITRTFTRKGDEEYTHTLKVENSDGLRYQKPQEVLDALLGEIGFDPFEFVKMKPDAQADTLLDMVPLRIDIEEFQRQDTIDTAKRRDINRDGKALVAQRDAIPKEEMPTVIPDRNALVATLGDAADTNGAIERERMRREDQERQAHHCIQLAENARREAARLRVEVAKAELAAEEQDETATEIKLTLAALPPLDEPVDTDAVREQLREAEQIAALVTRQNNRAALEVQVEMLRAQSQALTDAMEDRATQRNTALAEARMPVAGLSFHIPEAGKPRVYFNGVPFEQASTAEQIRASTAIAMAGNPSLRVLRIKDGSLLDEDSLAILHEMAATEDWQLWIEKVGTGGVGIIMEDGSIAGGVLTEVDRNSEATTKSAPSPKKAEKGVGEKLL